MRMGTPTRFFFALVYVFGLGLTSVGSAVAGSKSYDTALEGRPCDIVTADMVATTYQVPVKQLKQSQPVESLCAYEMTGSGKILNVKLSVAVFDTNKAAEAAFISSTRSMTVQDMAEKLKELGIEFDEEDRQFARDLGLPDPQPTGVQFQDVDGIADQARFQTDEGVLHVQQGNLLMKLDAFYGPSMKKPDTLTLAAMEGATSSWKQDTMDERREQSTALAKAALAAL